MSRAFGQLTQVTEMLEERALQHYRDVLAEEGRLHRELDALADLQRGAVQDDVGIHARRISGAEDQWSAWLAQRRLSLNQALVSLRLRKEQLRDAARLAHARQTVTRELSDQAAAKEAAHRRARTEEALRALTLLQRADR